MKKIITPDTDLGKTTDKSNDNVVCYITSEVVL